MIATSYMLLLIVLILANCQEFGSVSAVRADLVKMARRNCEKPEERSAAG